MDIFLKANRAGHNHNHHSHLQPINPEKPWVLYIGRAYSFPPNVAFYIYFLTNICTDYFKHAAHSPFFSSECRLFHNTTFLVRVLFTFYIQRVLKCNVKPQCQKVSPLQANFLSGPFKVDPVSIIPCFAHFFISPFSQPLCVSIQSVLICAVVVLYCFVVCVCVWVGFVMCVFVRSL
jgi:hypothetical protein